MASKNPVRARLALLAPVLCLAGCGSSTLMHTLAVNPPDASVYVNGVRVGQGSSRPVEFDFSDCTRVCIQATHPDYKPEMEWVTEKEIRHMMSQGKDKTIVLQTRQ